MALDARRGIPRVVDAGAVAHGDRRRRLQGRLDPGPADAHLHDAGAYARFSPYGVTKHAFHHCGAYSIPNLRFDGFVCFTNRVPTTAMRGFGVTSVSFAVETHMNRIAQVLGIDPWELRLKNANRIGDTTGNGVVLKDPSTVPVTLAAAERIGVELGAGSAR